VHFKEMNCLVEGPFNNLSLSRIRLPVARKYYNKRSEEITRAAMEFAGRHAPDGYDGASVMEDSRFDPRYESNRDGGDRIREMGYGRRDPYGGGRAADSYSDYDRGSASLSGGGMYTQADSFSMSQESYSGLYSDPDYKSQSSSYLASAPMSQDSTSHNYR
jgi:hypothetical protein